MYENKRRMHQHQAQPDVHEKLPCGAFFRMPIIIGAGSEGEAGYLAHLSKY